MLHPDFDQKQAKHLWKDKTELEKWLKKARKLIEARKGKELKEFKDINN